MKAIIKALTPASNQAPTTAQTLSVYDDVLTVLLAQYETNLKNKSDEFNQQLKEAQASRDAHHAQCAEFVISQLDQYVNTQQVGDMTIEITKPSRADNAIHFEWALGYATTFLELTAKIDLSAVRDHIMATSSDPRLQHAEHFEYYFARGNAGGTTRVTKMIILDAAVVEKQMELNEAVTEIHNKGYEIKCLQSQINQKERQLRAAIAQKKLEAAGMSDLLNDPALMSVVSMDSDLEKLVQVD